MMKGSISLTQTRAAFALAKQGALPLEPPGNQGRTRSCSATLRDEGEMPTRRDIRAITRGAQARPGAALILGGLLLLMVPSRPAGRFAPGHSGETASTEPTSAPRERAQTARRTQHHERASEVRAGPRLHLRYHLARRRAVPGRHHDP